jgi:hypothetical protein
MERLVAVLYLVAAAGNLAPAVGALGAARLEALYGIAFADPSLVVLMRHRALLLGIVGSLLAVAAFRPAWRGPALAAGLMSMVSFCALVFAEVESNAAIRRVAVLDVGLIASAMGAAVLDARRRAAA